MPEISRRRFLRGVAVGTAALTLAPILSVPNQEIAAAAPQPLTPTVTPPLEVQQASTSEETEPANKKPPSFFKINRATTFSQSIEEESMLVEVNRSALFSDTFTVDTESGMEQIVTVSRSEYSFGRHVLIGKMSNGGSAVISVNIKTGAIGGTFIDTSGVTSLAPSSVSKSKLLSQKTSLPGIYDVAMKVPVDPNEVRSKSLEIIGNASTIDVLLPYTERAKNLMGDKDAIEDELVRQIALTNIAHKESDTKFRYRIVGMFQTDGVEEEIDHDTVARLREKGDGKFEDVHIEREKVGADMVLLIDAPTGMEFCGANYILSKRQLNTTAFAEYAFGIAHIQQSCRDIFVIPHELGHGVGADHNPENAQYDPTYHVSDNIFGFRGTISRDIMSYPDPEKPFLILQPRFSNAEQRILLERFGDERSNIANASNITYQTAANLLEERVPFPDLAIINAPGRHVIKGTNPQIEIAGTYDESTAPTFMQAIINFNEKVELVFKDGKWSLPIDVSAYRGRIHITIVADNYNGVTTFIDATWANKFLDISLPPIRGVNSSSITVLDLDGTVVDKVTTDKPGSHRLWAPSKPFIMQTATDFTDGPFEPTTCMNASYPIQVPENVPGIIVDDPRMCLSTNHTALPITNN